jgi:hypothetical protein
MSTKNVRTDGLPEPQNDVEGSYTLMTINDYSPMDSDSPNRKATDVTNLRTGDQKM